MTHPSNTVGPRELACAGCGTPFSCERSAQCWCAAETFRLPMPTGRDDCLCADCLRKLAATATDTAAGHAA